MDGILLSKKIGIIGGGISGLVVGIFLAKEGHQVSIFEKKSLLSETSSKTTKAKGKKCTLCWKIVENACDRTNCPKNN